MSNNAKRQEALRFGDVEFTAVHFDIIGKPNNESDVRLNINPKVSYTSDTLFHIIFDIEIKVEDVFQLNIVAVGFFELGEEILKEDKINIKEQLVNTNAPAIVFPYIRSFVSTLTSNLGTIPTLTIPTHFFNGKLEEVKESEN